MSSSPFSDDNSDQDMYSQSSMSDNTPSAVSDGSDGSVVTGEGCDFFEGLLSSFDDSQFLGNFPDFPDFPPSPLLLPVIGYEDSIPLDNDMFLPSSSGMNADNNQYLGEEMDSLTIDHAGSSGQVDAGYPAEAVEEPEAPEASLQEPCTPLPRTKRAARKWTRNENAILLEVVEQVQREMMKGKRIWTKVMKLFNQRSGANLSGKQCREHYERIQASCSKGAWSDEEKAYLHQYINGDISMAELRRLVRRNNKQIQERLRIEKKNKNPWSERELDELKTLIRIYGVDYSRITGMMQLKGFDRSYQQIRSKVNALIKTNAFL